MRHRFSALGRVARRFPRAHLILSGALIATVSLVAMVPESGESRSERVQTLTLPKHDAGDQLARLESSRHQQAQLETPTASVPTLASQPQERWQRLTVKPGDTLSGLLQEHGVTATQVYRLVNGHPRLKELADIRPGESFQISLDNGGELNALRYHPSRIETVEAELDGERWQVAAHTREYLRRTRFADGTIDNSLFLAGHAAGMSDNLTMQLANIFGWDVDFVQDIRQGDRFRVLYEELYLDGEKVGEGNILAAEFWNRGRHLTAYRFQTRSGDTEYLDADGNSMRKAFIRTPVSFTRISSRFNLGRKHPILNRVRAHRGIDYAARSGTPIKAAGKGKVIFAGVKGGYGNVVIIQHGQQYTTLYGHMKGFAKGIRVGSRVNQNQTIGYVGMTGLATGPHLHYEFRVNGTHRDPLTVPLPKARGVDANEKPQFLVQAKRMQSQITMFAEAATLASSNVF
ncbi:peptidase M23 [Alcanivorax sp. N3-2A]|nr:peptidase M23 [Alcanivorax sp. N3-2A]